MMISEEIIPSLVGGVFAVICVVVGAGITGIGNYRDRLRKRREDKNKTVFCLLSLYFYVSHLCADDPLQKVVESCFDDVRRGCGIKDTDSLEDELKKILSPTQYTSVQKYLSNGIDELKQRLKDAVDRLSARNPILAYSLEAKLNVLSMMDLAENYVAEGMKKYSALRGIEISPDNINKMQQDLKKDIMMDVMGSIKENLYAIESSRKGRKRISFFLENIQSSPKTFEGQKNNVKDIVQNVINRNNV